MVPTRIEKAPERGPGAKDWAVPRSCNVESSAGFRRHRQPALPPPWTVEDKDAYFIVRDHNGQALTYVYAEDKRTGAKPLTRDEAQRIAANIAKLPKLLHKP